MGSRLTENSAKAEKGILMLRMTRCVLDQWCEEQRAGETIRGQFKKPRVIWALVSWEASSGIRPAQGGCCDRVVVM